MARTRSFTPHHRDSRPASKTPAGVANAHVAAARQAASIGDITICPAVPPAGAVLTHDAAHYGGWTQVLADYNGDRLDRLVYALDAASWRTWTSRSNGDGRVDLSLDANDQTSWRAWVAGRPSTCSMHRRAIQLYVEVGCQRYLTLVL